METTTGHILIVDDLPANIRLLEGILKVAGFDVEAATSGEEALDCVAQSTPDVVLLDVMMPGMDGFEACRRIKSQTSWLPVVMVTALQETEDRVAALEAGADDFLTKPVEEIEVVARVNSLVRLKRQREELETAYRDLRRAESMRDGLSAMLVHDLRTPLTAILGSLETLKMADLDELQNELVEIGMRSSNRLLILISDLLDVSKMESGEMKLSRAPVDVAKLVNESLDQVFPGVGPRRTTPSGREVELEIAVAPDLPTLNADTDLLSRVLSNLLGNAAKFIPREGRITISVTPQAVATDGTSGVLFSLRDNGQGIPLEDQTRIFDKFGQVETVQAGRKLSTGLGLTFCKLAIEAHGGRIWVESTPGEGSDFRFVVPSDG